MSRLKIGDRVEIVKSTVEDLNGKFGVIKKKADGWDWWVTLEGGTESLGFDAYELAPATQQPATEADAGAGEYDAMAHYDELLSQLNGKLGTTAISMLRTHFAAEHSMRTHAEAKLAAAEARAASVVEIANDYRDQIWVHQGTLRVLKSWLQKAGGFGVEDGFTESAILGMVTHDLEASEKMDTRTLVAQGKV